MLSYTSPGWRSLFGALLFSFMAASILLGQTAPNRGDKFEQLDILLPTPNSYRGADGAPGPDYWQQQVDYDIDCMLDTENQRLNGTERITYHNLSPHTLRYLWLQLDENEHSPLADRHYFDPSGINSTMDEQSLRALEAVNELEKYGHKIERVMDEKGTPLKYLINKTMMRIDLPRPLAPGEKFVFQIDWHYYLVNRIDPITRGRGGYEYFPKDDNYLFTITQWFPRLCVYSDFEGWQNKQFTGRGEFALNFGDYHVKITVPDDYIVGATGECQNYEQVLNATQLQRWRQARNATEPLEIVTLEEARKNESVRKSKKTKTWIYRAENVRDFAWTASRKFIWDAMPHYTETGKRVMCMSYYPKESYPIYRKYSTKTVAHTLATYSKYTFPYPYPVAISVEAANGMEYPMICFNYGRAEEDGTYTERAKYGAISVIIHEVGHNYFPMIVNSDERQWSWMDEGLNTFLQFLTEQEFDNNYPSRRGPAHLITDYMRLPKDELEPIMTNSENIVHFGPNAYAKPATALNILRETIMGRELFDFAFKQYAQRWAFKHPTPADFFRAMEDASGVDLDWFWRGWFFGIDPVDIAIDSVKWFKVDLKRDPPRQERTFSQKIEAPFEHLSKQRNREEGIAFSVEEDPELRDAYTDYRPWESADSLQTTTMYLYDQPFGRKEKEARFGGKNYYQLFFSNKGGLVMPIILEWTFEDGSKEIERIPAEIWRKNQARFSKVFVKDKVVSAIQLDPFKETADIDESNNSWPVREMPSRFEVFKQHKMKEEPNLMQRMREKKPVRP
jgi:hypothetical protein